MGKLLQHKKDSAIIGLAVALTGGLLAIPSASAATSDSGDFYINAVYLENKDIDATVGKLGGVSGPSNPGTVQPGTIESVSVPESGWMDLVYGNREYLAVASGGIYQVMSSPDGKVWTTHPAPQRTWQSVTYGNGRYVAVSQDGETMTSPDGRNWTVGSKITSHLYTVTFGNGVFVAGGEENNNNTLRGVIFSSTDGVNWTERSLPAGTQPTLPGGSGRVSFTDSIFADGKFYMNTSWSNYQSKWRSGLVLESTNGATWTSKSALPGTTANSFEAYGLGIQSVVTSPSGTFYGASVMNEWSNGELKLFKVQGTGWEEIPMAGLPSKSSADVLLIGARGNELLMSAKTRTLDPMMPTNELYSSTDGGRNWTKVGSTVDGLRIQTAFNGSDCAVGLPLSAKAAMRYCS